MAPSARVNCVFHSSDRNQEKSFGAELESEKVNWSASGLFVCTCSKCVAVCVFCSVLLANNGGMGALRMDILAHLIFYELDSAAATV